MILNRTVLDFHALPDEIQAKVKEHVECLLDGSGLLYESDGLFNVLLYKVNGWKDGPEYDGSIEKDLDEFFNSLHVITNSDNVILIEAEYGFF